MSTPTLAVDTASIRTVAEIVDQAADAFGGAGGTHRDACPLAAGSLGSTPAADTVVAAAGHQLTRAQDASNGLADRTRTIAGAMQTAATFFDLVESTIGGGR